MNLFGWLRPRAPEVDPALALRLQALIPTPPWRDISLREQRWIVLDLETTGLSLTKDQVLSVGAVTIEDGAIALGQNFERTLARPNAKPTPSVLLHGLGPSAIAAGSDPAASLVELMEFIGDSPVLAFHAPFDRHMLGRALRDSLAYTLRTPFIDVAEIAALLFPEGPPSHGGLDAWLDWFGLEVGERHQASADALVTAQLALILFSQARRRQLDSPRQLQLALSQWQRRQHSPTL